MFVRLFIKECRQTAKSLIYWLIVVILIFDFATQLGSTEIMTEPKEGQEEYGYHASNDENVIMESTLGALAEEYVRGNYVTYPIGFYKNVTVNDKEEKRIGKIIKETTGISSKEEAEKAMSGWYASEEKKMAENGEMKAVQNLSLKPLKNLSYERFTELMEETDDILGGGSKYGETYRKGNAMVPKTYEEAQEEYRQLIENDRLTGGYARLFCDYMTLFLGILPVFLAVARGLRDRRAGMQELIYTRKSSSICIILSRYGAMLVMLLLPLIVISMIPLSQCLKYASASGISADAFAYVKYIFGWILPTIMAAAATGVFFTELTDSALAVLIQGAWWFAAVFGGTGRMGGGMYGWNLVPRHNTELNWAGFHGDFMQLAANRLMYAALSVILVMFTAFIYSKKRKGRYRFSWKGIGRLRKQI